MKTGYRVWYRAEAWNVVADLGRKVRIVREGERCRTVFRTALEQRRGRPRTVYAADVVAMAKAVGLSERECDRIMNGGDEMNVTVDEYKQMADDSLSGKFKRAMRQAGIEFEEEFAFGKPIGRKWRADFLVRPNVLIEIEGGLWVTSRHRTGMGFANDCRKYNAAAVLGYRVLRYTSEDLKRLDEVIDEIRSLIGDLPAQ